MSQIDKLANDIEGYINDFESGVTGKEETIKALCYYVGERAKTAVEAEKVKIMEEKYLLPTKHFCEWEWKSTFVENGWVSQCGYNLKELYADHNYKCCPHCGNEIKIVGMK